MKRIWAVVLVFSVFTASLSYGCPAQAHPPRAYGPYSIDIEDEYGAPLRTFRHDGEVFVLGNYGQRYTIVLRNQSGRRVEAVVSVDGRDVISGRVGDYAHERGYILGPYQTVRIEGFRKSYEQVAAFRFSTPQASYSARMGTPENVGVIGAAFFPERVRRERPPVFLPESEPEARREAPTTVDDLLSNETAAAKRKGEAPPAAATTSGAEQSASARSRRSYGESDAYDGGASVTAAPSVNNLGTEYGETRNSQVEEVRFVRASSDKPAYVAVLRYDNATGLAARGIELDPRVSYREPNPFPRNRFAPPPP